MEYIGINNHLLEKKIFATSCLYTQLFNRIMADGQAIFFASAIDGLTVWLLSTNDFLSSWDTRSAIVSIPRP